MDRESRNRARVLVFREPGRVELREERLAPAPGQVLVRSRLIGISHGTEMLAFRGEMPAGLAADEVLPGLPGTLGYPLAYGYINTGVTEAGRRVFAFAPHQDAFYADPGGLIELPDDLAFEDAVFLASLETALGVAHDAAPRFGETVLVVGQGVVGLLAAEVLLRCGVERVITVERHPLRRQASGRIGCLALAPEEGTAAAIRRLAGGRGVDAAVNLSAAGEGLQLAIDAAAFEATVVEASWYGTRRVSLDLGSAFHRRRLALRSSQVSRLDPALSGRWDKARRFAAVVKLLAELRPSRYITHRFPLEEAPAAFRLLAEHPEQVLQVVLEP
jgi:threonine dehydrogenase-like Zn-dependent dehydrogenase